MINILHPYSQIQKYIIITFVFQILCIFAQCWCLSLVYINSMFMEAVYVWTLHGIMSVFTFFEELRPWLITTITITTKTNAITVITITITITTIAIIILIMIIR